MPGILRGRGAPVAEVPHPCIRVAGREIGEPDIEHRFSERRVCRKFRYRRHLAGIDEGIDVCFPTATVLPDNQIAADHRIELLRPGRINRHLPAHLTGEVADVDTPYPAPFVLPGDEIPIDRRGNLPGGAGSNLLLSRSRPVEIIEVDSGSTVPVVLPDDPVPRYRGVCLAGTAPGDLMPFFAQDIIQPDVAVPGALLPDDIPLRERRFPLGHRRAGEKYLVAGLDLMEADIRAPSPGIVPDYMPITDDRFPSVGLSVGEHPRLPARYLKEADIQVRVQDLLPDDVIT